MSVFFPFGMPSTSSYAVSASRALYVNAPSTTAQYALVAQYGPPGTPGIASSSCPPGYQNAETASPPVTPTERNYILCYAIPSPSVQASVTRTPSVTPSLTPTTTTTPSVTVTPSNPPTPGLSITPTRTVSPTPSLTPSITPSITMTVSTTPSVTATRTPTVSVTPSRTQSVSVTPSPSQTVGLSSTPTPSISPSISVTPSFTPSITVTPSTSTCVCNAQAVGYPTGSTLGLACTNDTNSTIYKYSCDTTGKIFVTIDCGGGGYTGYLRNSSDSAYEYENGIIKGALLSCVSPTPTRTPSNSITPSTTPSITPSITPSNTMTPSITPSNTMTPSITPSVTPSNTRTPSITPSITPSNTMAPSITPSVTPSITPSNTMTPSITPSPSTPQKQAKLSVTKLGHPGTAVATLFETPLTQVAQITSGTTTYYVPSLPKTYFATFTYTGTTYVDTTTSYELYINGVLVESNCVVSNQGYTTQNYQIDTSSNQVAFDFIARITRDGCS